MLSEKVDTTVSKGVLRVLGTAVGGTLGKRAAALRMHAHCFWPAQPRQGWLFRRLLRVSACCRHPAGITICCVRGTSAGSFGALLALAPGFVA